VAPCRSSVRAFSAAAACCLRSFPLSSVLAWAHSCFAPHNHERHCRNAVAFSFKLASALGNGGELLALARYIAHRSPQEFRLSSILRWLNRSDRYRQNYQTDGIGRGPPVLPDPATYITEERRQFEPVSFTSVATAPIATTSNFSTGACVGMTCRCPIPRARR
jgi:hypothetical protein